jgi:hypothetical protein
MSGNHEHGSHASDDPFDRRVAMTMVIVAACLAFVSMMGHQAENDVLRMHAEYASLKVQESNAWSQFQSKRMRQHTDENALMLLRLLTPALDTNDERNRRMKELQSEVARYTIELRGESALSDVEKELVQGDAKAEKSKKEQPLEAKARAVERQAESVKHEAEQKHEQAERLDLAHLAIELGLVLCSISVLTKRKAFWLVGIGATLVGLVLAASAMAMKHPEPTSSHAQRSAAYLV